MGSRRCIPARSIFFRKEGSDSAETLVDEPGFEIDPLLSRKLASDARKRTYELIT